MLDFAQTESVESVQGVAHHAAYRLAKYKTISGAGVTLIGLPHPVAVGKKGLPVDFPKILRLIPHAANF